MKTQTRAEALARFNESNKEDENHNHKYSYFDYSQTEFSKLLKLANAQAAVIEGMREAVELTITTGLYMGSRKHLHDALALADAPYGDGE